MKKLSLIGALLIFSIATFAQCNQYYNVKEGTNWTTTNYSAKGKLESKTIQKVTEYSESSNGFEATFEITSVDDKGEQNTLGSSTMRCEDGVIYFDMEDMFPEEQMQSMQGFDMTVDGTNLELPANLKVGETLNDAEINLHISASPMKLNFKVNITDRQVLAKENLKTPAGDFDCFKLSQNVYMKTIGKMEMKTIEWYSEGVGMVKSESYNKKGKMTGYSILTVYNY